MAVYQDKAKNRTKKEQCMNSYLFIDVETPNCNNNSICSIGAIKTDLQGNIIQEISRHIDPQDRFDAININVHGITADDVYGKETFEQLWHSTLEALFSDSVLVAHNANFDLNVITKCLDTANISYTPFEYICTKIEARSRCCCSSLKLPDLCQHYGIVLDNHHNAISDSRACMQLFFALMTDSPMTSRAFKQSNNSHYDTARKIEPILVNSNSKEFAKLLDSIHAVIEDGIVLTEECAALLKLILESETLLQDPVASQLVKGLQQALRDGWVSPEESDYLFKLMESIACPRVDEVCDIAVSGSSFVVTGEFSYGRNKVKEWIVLNGGKVVSSPSGKTNYVVIGSLGSKEYSFGNYGGKIKKAMALQAQGKPIRIINESDLPLNLSELI